MKTRFILNPTSGRNRQTPTLAADIRRFITAHSLDAQLVLTEESGHATHLAREAAQQGCERIVAVGGDGTMHETARGVLHTPATLALVPRGSGNGLARHLGIPRNLDAALTLLVADARCIKTAAIDTGTVDGQPFFNVMGLGLDAEIGHRFNQLQHRGLAAYTLTALGAWRDRRRERVTIATSHHRETLEVLFIAIANSDQYGYNARIAPHAKVDDGTLDLIAVQSVGLIGAIELSARLFHGSFDRSGRVRQIRGSHFTIERAAPGLIHIDGEIHHAAATLEISILPLSLRLLLPAQSPAGS